MEREEFYALPPTKKVDDVNNLLKHYSLKEIAIMYGYAYSTFTTEMRNNGEFQYNKKTKKYVRTVEIKENVNNNEALEFVTQNRKALQRLVELYESKALLILDKKVYSKEAKFENKSIKMNKDIYKEFSDFCDANYPHLKLQDLIAQSLLDFMKSYKTPPMLG